MNNWYYIKVTYKGGYIHFYLTNDYTYYKSDKDVAKIEII